MKVYDKAGRAVFQVPVFYDVGIDELCLALQYLLETGKAKKLYKTTRPKLLNAIKEQYDGYGRMFHMTYSPDKAKMKGHTRAEIRQRVIDLFPELNLAAVPTPGGAALQFFKSEGDTPVYLGDNEE